MTRPDMSREPTSEQALVPQVLGSHSSSELRLAGSRCTPAGTKLPR